MQGIDGSNRLIPPSFAAFYQRQRVPSNEAKGISIRLTPSLPPSLSQELRTLLETYGPLDDSEGLAIEAPPKKGFVLVRYLNNESAQKAKEALTGVGGKEGGKEGGREGGGPPLVGGRRVPKVQYSVMWSEEEEVSVKERRREGGEAGGGKLSGGARLQKKRAMTSPSLPPSLPPSLLPSSATRSHILSHWIHLSRRLWRWTFPE